MPSVMKNNYYFLFAELLTFLMISYRLIDGLHVSYDIDFRTKCVDDKYIIHKILQTSLDQCVVECVRRPGCLAISFCKRFTLCNLLNTDGLSESASTTTDRDDCDFVAKSGMRYNLPTGCQECKDGQNCDFENEKCTITECPKLSLDNGVLLGNMNGIGNRVKFTCNSGYKTETSEMYATCEETGEWSITPKCVEEIKGCNEGWIVFEKSCYFFGNTERTFHDAEIDCKLLDKNAHLANVETAAENNFIKEYLLSRYNWNGPPHWFGLTDVQSESVWRHFPSEEVASFFDWGFLEPNQYKAANCAVLWPLYSFKWADEYCTNTYKPICEHRAQ